MNEIMYQIQIKKNQIRILTLNNKISWRLTVKFINLILK